GCWSASTRTLTQRLSGSAAEAPAFAKRLLRTPCAKRRDQLFRPLEAQQQRVAVPSRQIGHTVARGHEGERAFAGGEPEPAHLQSWQAETVRPPVQRVPTPPGQRHDLRFVEAKRLQRDRAPVPRRLKFEAARAEP